MSNSPASEASAGLAKDVRLSNGTRSDAAVERARFSPIGQRKQSATISGVTMELYDVMRSTFAVQPSSLPSPGISRMRRRRTHPWTRGPGKRQSGLWIVLAKSVRCGLMAACHSMRAGAL